MFDVGDQIVTGAGAGTVHEITGRTVILRTPDGREINVPNTVVVNEALTNLTTLGQRRSSLEVGVAYGSDLDVVVATLLDAALSSDRVFDEPAPDVLMTEFGDNSLNFEVRFWHDPTVVDERRAVDEVARAVDKAFAAAGIEIPFPQRILGWADGGSAGLSAEGDG